MRSTFFHRKLKLKTNIFEKSSSFCKVSQFPRQLGAGTGWGLPGGWQLSQLLSALGSQTPHATGGQLAEFSSQPFLRAPFHPSSFHPSLRYTSRRAAAGRSLFISDKLTSDHPPAAFCSTETFTVPQRSQSIPGAVPAPVAPRLAPPQTSAGVAPLPAPASSGGDTGTLLWGRVAAPCQGPAGSCLLPGSQRCQRRGGPEVGQERHVPATRARGAAACPSPRQPPPAALPASLHPGQESCRDGSRCGESRSRPPRWIAAPSVTAEPVNTCDRR